MNLMEHKKFQRYKNFLMTNDKNILLKYKKFKIFIMKETNSKSIAKYQYEYVEINLEKNETNKNNNDTKEELICENLEQANSQKTSNSLNNFIINKNKDFCSADYKYEAKNSSLFSFEEVFALFCEKAKILILKLIFSVFNFYLLMVFFKDDSVRNRICVLLVFIFNLLLLIKDIGFIKLSQKKRIIYKITECIFILIVEIHLIYNFVLRYKNYYQLKNDLFSKYNLFTFSEFLFGFTMLSLFITAYKLKELKKELVFFYVVLLFFYIVSLLKLCHLNSLNRFIIINVLILICHYGLIHIHIIYKECHSLKKYILRNGVIFSYCLVSSFIFTWNILFNLEKGNECGSKKIILVN